MIRVAIVGASGYTGAELSRILCNHPEVNITAATSRQYAGQKLSSVFPNLRGKVDIICENLTSEEITAKADVIFTAVPHKTAMDLVPHFLESGKKVIDLSADFRLREVEVYEQWYQEHSAPDFIKEAVYGLPEIYRSEITKARLIANPGCYPTSIILAVAPLLKAKVIKPETLIADAKSGTSGAGRAAAVGTLFCEVADGFRPYKVGGTHRHTPEIEQELSLAAGSPLSISFTPHLLPISRGIMSTIYAELSADISSEQICEIYQASYRDEPFIRLLLDSSIPATQFVRGSNFCDIGFAIDSRTNRIILMSTIDNVVKGAAGQAVQNLNLICGFNETLGLETAPFFP